MGDRKSSSITVIFTSVMAIAGLVASPTHAQCRTGLFILDGPQCMPLTRGDALVVIVDLDNHSKDLSAIDAPAVERAAVQVLTEGLRAPATGSEHPRTDVKISSQSITNFATFSWTPENPKATTTVLLRCFIRNAQDGAATTAMASVACRMTRGKMRIEAGWMTGYQNYSATPSVALLKGRDDVDGATLRSMLRQIFRDMIYVSRLGHKAEAAVDEIPTP
jgi:hypothetical protein